MKTPEELFEEFYAKSSESKKTPFDVIYRGDACDEQVRWGSNTDPRGLLVSGEIYTVTKVEPHAWHEKYYLKDVVGKFNSVHFDLVSPEKKDESVLRT